MSRECSVPPAQPVQWLAKCKKTKSSTVVTSRTWFDGRAQAMAVLGCGPDEIEVTMKEQADGAR